jgi:hypothetical protein
VVSGARLPYELQPRPENSENGSDDGFYSEDDEADSEDGSSTTELKQRFFEIVDIIDNLYKLSVRIRSPSLRSRSLKAASFRIVDPDTGVDMFEEYSQYDLLYVRELIRCLRAPNSESQVEKGEEEDTFLIQRLGKSITLRRRQFKYWKRHREKLGVISDPEEPPQGQDRQLPQPELHHHQSLEAEAGNVVVFAVQASPSEKVPKSLLSGTEVTHHHQSLDEMVDTQSVTSYATTTKDLSGRRIELPSPPRAADGERDFECPYCYIICPSRYSRGPSWR